ncbi:hypothetical protein B0O80DRAFT_504509 [Mortierella sp. GBAus27b]|nr:hypothetical protein BGX31_008682 [Mortierella sp. GBA43]KAI8345203.1 hypothetical protein B0O80DRAFT_504509 [Mortierella sp. GBAus27b]
MTMPVRWTLLLFLLLVLISLLALSRINARSFRSDKIAFTPTGTRSTSWTRRWHRNVKTPTSSLLLHHLQEEQNLRDRNAQILLDLEEDDQRLEMDCATPTLASDPSSHPLSREERSLQDADFELELSLEVQRLVQKHQYDSTDLNGSPSALQRHLKRKLRNRRRLMSAHKASLYQQARISYNSQECVAWRAKQSSSTGAKGLIHGQSRSMTPEMTAAAALSRFQQLHPNRHGLNPKSIFARTLNALAQKQYEDPSGFIVELDPIKVMAGSRRASTYENDDIHVLVLDMQWDPEVTVVVGNVLDETVKLRQEGYRPVMLNVGDSEVPGGDYHLDNATTNEADLFRRTTLHQCLDQEPRKSRFYPIPETGGVYCPNQAVFRHGLDRSNEFMDRFEWISVVSVASIRKLETREKDGGLGGVQFLEGEDDDLRRNILAAMKVGVSQGHDALVLPPHGTELGQNPPEAVAAIYRSIIGRDFMGGRKRFQTYKKIVMVLDPELAYKVVNETSSYRPAQTANTTSTPLQDDETESSNGGDVEQSHQEDQDSQKEDDDQDKKGERVTQDDQEIEKQGDDENLNENSLPERYAQDQRNEQELFISEEDGVDDPEEEEGEDDDKTTRKDLLDEEPTEEPDQADDQEPEDDEQATNDELTGSLNEPDSNETDDDNEAPETRLKFKMEDSDSEELSEDKDLEGETDLSETVEGSPSSTDGDSGSEADQDAEGDNQENQPFEPLIETVQDVFERMLEQRSLLIVKNRARGLVDTEDLDNLKPTSSAAPGSSEPTGSSQPEPTSSSAA